MQHLKERLADDELLLGLLVSYPAAGIVEEIGRGWDFVWIDGQHGQMDYRAILECVRAAQGIGLPVVVRVPSHDPGCIGSVLDMAPDAVLVPVVDTPEQARRVVEAARFPPLGRRSVGGKRPDSLYGREYYLEESNRILLVVQIESCEGIENVQAIAATEGIDSLFFGPNDMKLQLGIPISTPLEESAKLLGAMEAMADAAKRTGKSAGCLAGTTESIRRAIAMGYRFIAGGSDIGFLRDGSRRRLAELGQAR